MTRLASAWAATMGSSPLGPTAALAGDPSTPGLVNPVRGCNVLDLSLDPGSVKVRR